MTITIPIKESTSIDAAVYDTESHTLDITYKGGKKRSTYRYFHIPQTIIDGLIDAESKGKYVAAVIKTPEHPYQRLL
jgi:hypothetical protein